MVSCSTNNTDNDVNNINEKNCNAKTTINDDANVNKNENNFNNVDNSNNNSKRDHNLNNRSAQNGNYVNSLTNKTEKKVKKTHMILIICQLRQKTQIVLNI